MKSYLALLLALCAITVTIGGCGSNSDSTGSTTGSVADTKKADTTAPTADTTADAKKSDATSPANEVAGTWTNPEQGTLVLGDDKTFTLSNSDKAMGGTITVSGTYELGAASKYLSGGKEMSMKVTNVDLKATDPSKQADMDKQKATLLPAIAQAMADNSEKMDSATEMEIQGVKEKAPQKWTKKA